ncbi:hypothetical protein PIB30_033714 [Stylosanthes scabra]|uniref:Transposase-associated domain-containing protein n=1 Tax=Stylosanthes scabra TaxID=79078 RepID=A0ABU6YD84_9FABA|nr:hypothetical protein [Stylosanthes scabra]
MKNRDRVIFNPTDMHQKSTSRASLSPNIMVSDSNGGTKSPATSNHDRKQQQPPSIQNSSSVEGQAHEVKVAQVMAMEKSSSLSPPHQGPHHCRFVDAAAAVRRELPGVSTCCRPKKSDREPLGVPSPYLAAAAPCRRHSSTRPFVLHHHGSPPPPFTAAVPCPLCTSRPQLFTAGVATATEFRVAGVSRCPCSKCRLLNWIGPQEMTLHLYRSGFNPGYWIWTSHGKMDENNINHFETRAQHRSERVSRVANLDIEASFGEVNWEDNHERYNEMITDAFGMGNTRDLGEWEEEPNPDAKKGFMTC